MFITSKNKYLSNDMKIFGTCSIPLRITLSLVKTEFSHFRKSKIWEPEYQTSLCFTCLCPEFDVFDSNRHQLVGFMRIPFNHKDLILMTSEMN